VADSRYERFAVREPAKERRLHEVRVGRSFPLTYMSSTLVPEADVHVELGWIREAPKSVPQAAERVLAYDQMLLYIGMDWGLPQNLGATIECTLGGQQIVFNTTTAIFIPKGTPFGPVVWQEVQRPHVELAVVFGTGDPYGADDGGSAGLRVATPPEETRDFDYEQYVVRSPMREAGPPHVEGRQNPTMTYMSGTQVPGVKHYVEFGWIWDVPDPFIPKMRHDNYEEVVLHIGSNPEAPEDLGAVLQFGLGGELAEFDTTHCVYIPRTLEHGPLIWKEVRRPLIELALMLGAGTWAEGWEGSFFDLPSGSDRTWSVG